MLPTVLLPFNLSKSILNCSIMLLIYKPFTTALKKCRLIENSGTVKYKFNIKSAILAIVSIVIIICVLIYMVLSLKLGLSV